MTGVNLILSEPQTDPKKNRVFFLKNAFFIFTTTAVRVGNRICFFLEWNDFWEAMACECLKLAHLWFSQRNNFSFNLGKKQWRFSQWCYCFSSNRIHKWSENNFSKKWSFRFKFSLYQKKIFRFSSSRRLRFTYSHSDIFCVVLTSHFNSFQFYFTSSHFIFDPFWFSNTWYRQVVISRHFLCRQIFQCPRILTLPSRHIVTRSKFAISVYLSPSCSFSYHLSFMSFHLFLFTPSHLGSMSIFRSNNFLVY